ncbi:MAG: hypothetical protein R6T92_08785 [Desulfosalsimonadaceae bacterium]
MRKPFKFMVFSAVFAALCLFAHGCGQSGDNVQALEVPRGYVPEIRVEVEDRIFGFGPFVGYYFKPETPGDFTRLKFICFNERSFYTRDLPENAKLFEGTAVLTRLPDADFDLPESARINPVFFSEAPPQWLGARPEPKDVFVHFHSCYDVQGPVMTGYWIRHDAVAAFTYDMGGRVGPDSPLYHEATPGTDKDFARIIEFDYGPDR